LDDELFTLKWEHVENMAKVFTEENVYLQGVLTHVNFFNDEIAKMLATFSFGVIFGGENFCDSVLNDIQKHQNRNKLLEACRIAKLNGLNSRIEYIVGLPTETPETAVENINFIFSAISSGQIDVVIPYILVPHPGTEFYNNQKKYGIKIKDNNYENYIEEGSYPVCETKYLSRNQIYIYYLLLINMIMNARNVHKELGDNNFLSTSIFSRELFKEFFEKICSNDKELPV